MGIAGSKRKFTAFELETDIPALLRKGATEKLGGQLDFPRDVLTLLRQGVSISEKVGRMEHYTPSAVDCEEDTSRQTKGRVVTASCCGRAFAEKKSQ